MSFIKGNFFFSFCAMFLCFMLPQCVLAQNSDSPLFEGPTYADLHRSINEKHKFVGPYEFQPGALLYEGQWQTQLALKYDAYQGLLLLRHPRALGAPTIILNQEQISEFRLRGKRFVWLYSENEAFEAGFYEVLASSPNKTLFKKHQKKIQPKLRDGLAYFEFKDKPSYLLKEGDKFSPIKRPKTSFIQTLISAIERLKTDAP